MASIPGAAGTGAGYPQWTYNTFTHAISEVTNPASKAAAETVSFPTTIIFFTSDAAAQAYAKSQGGGTDISTNPLTGVANAAGSAASNAVGDTEAIANFLGALSNPNTWIRVVKVLAGGVLVIVGLAHMTGADNAIAKAARSVPIIPV